MKKSLIAMAALAATSAFAQSSVTLYGVADLWVGQIKQFSVNAANTVDTTVSQTKLDNGGQYGSRFGMRGTEDLGGGLKANFVFEGGLAPDTGTSTQGGATFGRQSWVGLENSIGQLNFGRQYGPYDNVKCGFSVQCSTAFDPTNGFQNPNGPFAGGAVTGTNVIPFALNGGVVTPALAASLANASSGRLGAFVGYQARINNAIKFQSANFGGVSGSVIYGFGENKTTTTGADSTLGFNLLYGNGPLNVALAYQTEKYPSLGNFKNNNTMIAANYDFGVAKVNVGYNQSRLVGSTFTLPSNEYFIGASAPFGAFTLQTAFARSQHKVVGGTTDTSFGLEGTYALSKRSFVYSGYQGTKIQNGNTITGANVTNSVFAVGVRHMF